MTNSSVFSLSCHKHYVLVKLTFFFSTLQLRDLLGAKTPADLAKPVKGKVIRLLQTLLSNSRMDSHRGGIFLAQLRRRYPIKWLECISFYQAAFSRNKFDSLIYVVVGVGSKCNASLDVTTMVTQRPHCGQSRTTDHSRNIFRIGL